VSADNSDPQEEGLRHLARLASLVTSAAEAAVRIASVRRRLPPAPTGGLPPASPGSAQPAKGAQKARSAPLTAPRPAPSARTEGAVSRAPAGRAAVLLRRPHEDLYAVHQEALEFYQERVSDSWVPTYLASRRLEVALEQPWSAGYAPAGWTDLTDHLRRRGWSDEVLVASGLSRPARTGRLIDHFRDRLVLPLRVRDDVVGFVGRCAEGADSRTPKYLNSPASAIYDKSATLYAARDPRDVRWWGATPVLVEGPLDAIAVSSCSGDRWAGVALCGTAMSDRHVDALVGPSRRAHPEVVVATDHDHAGQAAAETALRRLAARCGDLHRLELPPGQDPADALRQAGPDGLHALLTSGRKPLLTSVLDARLQRWEGQLQWVDSRVRAARHAAPVIAALPERARSEASRQLAVRLDLLQTTVEAAVEQAGRSVAGGPSLSRQNTVRQGTEEAEPERVSPSRRRGR